ncbi:MAG: HpcH/HpaI aldolase family protein [Alphaproteobacteria bacterium]|jgi:4-hydroxy-2-oxoheptanedioate aldolase
MPTNKLRAKFAAGRKCLGVWSNVIDTIYTESLAAAGFDFIILDNEHGPSMPRDTLLHMQVLSRMDCAAVVRVPWNDQVYIKRVLDAGADTIMVPMVETAEEAKAAVAACRYPPQGRRSFGPWRQLGLERDLDAWRERANDEVFVIVQIESAKAVENVDAIAAVEGVDALFIGPNDLSGTLGRLRAYDDPRFLATVEKAMAGIRRSGKPMGAVPWGSLTTAQMLRDGFSMVAASTELTLLVGAARAEVDAHRKAFGG